MVVNKYLPLLKSEWVVWLSFGIRGDFYRPVTGGREAEIFGPRSIRKAAAAAAACRPWPATLENDLVGYAYFGAVAAIVAAGCSTLAGGD